MSWPWVLVVLLLLIVFTSQFEWKQPFGNEIEVIPTISQKQQYSSKREKAVREKIILSQEKNIQKLNKLIQSLKTQLLQCGSENFLNDCAIPLNKHIDELEL